MPVLEKFTPVTVEKTLELLQEHKDQAVIMAGGTDLFIRMKKGLANPDRLINISNIGSLKTMKYDTISGLYLGALVTLKAIIESAVVKQNYKALHEAAGMLATPSIRTLATIGGNLCNAAPSADMAPILIALQAKACINDEDGAREIPLENFFAGPSQTILNKGLLVGIKIPCADCHGGSVYEKATRSQSVDLALCGVAVSLSLDDNGKIADLRVVLGAVAPTPLRACKTEAVLRGQKPSPELLQQVADMAVSEALPISDVRCKADYRSHLVSVLTIRALIKALARAKATSEE